MLGGGAGGKGAVENDHGSGSEREYLYKRPVSKEQEQSVRKQQGCNRVLTERERGGRHLWQVGCAFWPTSQNPREE